MFRKKRREKILREHEARQTQERFERNERAGKEIYARMAELKNVLRENLPDAVFMLSMAAKHQSEQIRQSIKDRTRYDFDFDTLPDVHFTIQQQDAVSMMAATIREQRLEGILEGLRLAGLLNEAPKRRRTSPQTDGVG
jgi:hypothetical protein